MSATWSIVMSESTDTPTVDEEEDATGLLLAGIDEMSTRRPVAAQIVSVTSSERTDSKELAQVLMGDARLAGRVMKLANSAHYGMGGRVSSLQFAITVVGFSTVRTLATLSLAESTDDSALPDDFWDLGTGLALAASRLAPRFREYQPDALCLGLLSQVGAALLHHHDRVGYRALVDEQPDVTRRGIAEKRRYGISGMQLSAAALTRWNFPDAMVLPLERVDDRTSPRGGLLRTAYEVVGRLATPDRTPVPVAAISCGMVVESDLPPVLYDVRVELTSMRGMFSGS
jgi:HD-like signal output (HDOD) protein